MTDINFPTKAQVLKPALLSIGLGLGWQPLAHGADNVVSKTVQVQTTTVAQNQESQKKINKLADAANKALEEYRLVLSEIDSLRTYNDQMEKLVASQNEEMESIRNQIKEIEVTNKEVVPLMIRMIDSLGKFVKLDVPFLMEERTARIESLREMMDRADVSTSEKFRRVLEAFQVENNYGRSIEAYRDTIKVGDTQRTVDFLRLGRVVLAYQTLDGKQSMLWDQTKREWVELPDSYRSTIQEGLKIARKQAAPDLLTLPVPTPEDA
jgi:vacuolar-type H+-ATPase subunit I/STV1